MMNMFVDSFLGPVMPGLGWVPSPRYTMRRIRVLRMMKEERAGRLLEIGPGAGALLIEFAQKGFQCEALEISLEARKILLEAFFGFGLNVPVYRTPPVEWKNRFDVLFAFEVLEHIKNHEEMLKRWASWLHPQGKLLLSVPAHMKLWGAGDEWAGHYRRYEKKPLKALLWNAGLEISAFECYGFPLANLLELLFFPLLYSHTQHTMGNLDISRRLNSDRSGIDRRPHMKIYPLLRTMPGKLILRAFSNIQGAFADTDLGSGYLVVARHK